MSTPLLNFGPESGFDSAPPSDTRSRIKRVVAFAIVVALHVGLLIAVVHQAALHQVDTLPPEPRVVTAQLIAPTPVATQPAVPKAPPPVVPPQMQPPPPQPVVKPPPPRPHIRPTVKAPALTPSPQAAAPVTPAPPAPAPPAPPSVAAPPAATPPPAAPVLSNTVPKNVEHIDCTIEKPNYPLLSRQHDESGRVVIALTIGDDGAVQRAVVRSSSGFPRLDDAARNAVLGAHCRPYRENGQALRAIVAVPFRFDAPDD